MVKIERLLHFLKYLRHLYRTKDAFNVLVNYNFHVIICYFWQFIICHQHVLPKVQLISFSFYLTNKSYYPDNDTSVYTSSFQFFGLTFHTFAIWILIFKTSEFVKSTWRTQVDPYRLGITSEYLPANPKRKQYFWFWFALSGSNIKMLSSIFTKKYVQRTLPTRESFYLQARTICAWFSFRRDLKFVIWALLKPPHIVVNFDYCIFLCCWKFGNVKPM